MRVNRIGDSSHVKIRIVHKHTILDYQLNFNYSGSGSLKIRGPIAADVDYEHVADHIMRIGGFKNKRRPVLMEQLKAEIPPVLYLLE